MPGKVGYLVREAAGIDCQKGSCIECLDDSGLMGSGNLCN